MAKYGLVQVNGETARDPALLLKENDKIYFNHSLIRRLQVHFRAPLRKYRQVDLKSIFVTIPKNFEYHQKIYTAIYKRTPTLQDLPEKGRLNRFFFKIFKAQSVVGR